MYLHFFRAEESQEADTVEAKLTLDDEISRQTAVRMAGKISCVDITLESRGVFKVLK